ncbi:Holliday junction DNA helicase subunit RuvA [Austwickia chelonae]|uniref:Holliday junction branch migration complex subunit RuvA n=1 Tax=Austwickia chelonae NBRC 105200 TaxID=1184607 RepID=K6VQ80_9MICO|nr:Holliday junction branch migration protein RuvA [Austwickia chelonae]GAB77500.1 Holliday junction ATP-dependent DNA helicase RuvA [Austwickia chelonae NBRC 105200]SEW11619.1 Holliday junction DNA helicase subunit RuvA [Austwickia chelonae]
MIASVRGTVSQVGLDHVVVQVGGFGMLAQLTPRTAMQLRQDEEVLLHTSMIVREDSMTLYGFGSVGEKSLFDLVQTVSGVGPRLALAMLAVHSPDDLRRAISGGDIAALTKVPGIGRKGAERLLLELRDKIAPLPPGAEEEPARPVQDDSWREQVRDALTGLGWSTKQADAVLEKVAADLTGPPRVPEVLRAALRELGR